MHQCISVSKWQHNLSINLVTFFNALYTLIKDSWQPSFIDSRVINLPHYHQNKCQWIKRNTFYECCVVCDQACIGHASDKVSAESLATQIEQKPFYHFFVVQRLDRKENDLSTVPATRWALLNHWQCKSRLTLCSDWIKWNMIYP